MTAAMPEVAPGSVPARMYEAEEEAFHRGLPGTVHGLMRIQLSWSDVKAYVDHVLGSPWVQERWPGLDVTLVPARHGRGAYVTGRGEMHLPPGTRGPVYLLHEIAHRATSKFVDESHGPEFCGVYLALLRKFVGAPAERLLRGELEQRDIHPVDTLVTDHPAKRAA